MRNQPQLTSRCSLVIEGDLKSVPVSAAFSTTFPL